MNVYDFDNTIFKGDSLTKFYFYCLRKKPGLIRFIFVQILYVFLRLIHAVSLSRAKEKCFCFYFALQEEERQTLLDGFWEKNRKNIKGWYLEQKKSDDLVISATPRVIIEPISKELGFKLIATEIDEENKKFLTKNCKGEEKLNRLREETDKPIDEFYSDSHSDKYIAREAKKAYFVSGNYVLDWDSEELQKSEVKKTKSQSAKTILKKVGISLGILLVSSVILFSLLIAVYAIPTSAMQTHRKESLDIIDSQGKYFYIFRTTIDNYTDKNFIDVATYDSGDGLLKRAFTNSGENISYIRYVSGFLVVLKPLMLALNVTGIRILNAVLHVLIIAALIFLFIKKKLLWTMFAFFAAYIFMSPISMAYTLAFNADFLVMTISMILMLALDKWLTKHNFYPYFFILIGIFISFFDLLMFTLVAFGVPLVLYFNLHPPKSIKEFFKKLVILGICWAFGYASIILIKEIIASIVSGVNVLEIFKEVFLGRSSTEVWGVTYGRFHGIRRNLDISIIETHLIGVTFGLLAVGLHLFFTNKEDKKNYVCLVISVLFGAAIILTLALSLNGSVRRFVSLILILLFAVYIAGLTFFSMPFDKKVFMRYLVSFLVIAIIPFAWYLVFSNHSIIHCWYTFRLIGISVFAIFSAFTLYIGTVRAQAPYYRDPAKVSTDEQLKAESKSAKTQGEMRAYVTEQGNLFPFSMTMEQLDRYEKAKQPKSKSKK